VRAPALDPIACWRVERTGDVVFVREKLAWADPKVDACAARATAAGAPASVVIVDGGAAGLAAADMLRREAYDGPITKLPRPREPAGRARHGALLIARVR